MNMKRVTSVVAASAMSLALITAAGAQTAASPAHVPSAQGEQPEEPSVQSQQPEAPLAPISATWRYQGRLRLSGGLVNDSCDFIFGAYSDAIGGAALDEDTNVVVVAKGLFASDIEWNAALFNGMQLFLDVQVRCPAGAGAYTQLTPRTAIRPAPYAMGLRLPFSGTIDSNGAPIFAVNNTSGSGDSPSFLGLSRGGDGVRGISYGAGSADNGVYGSTNSTSSSEAGVYGVGASNAKGGYFTSTSGIGVYGTSGADYGVYGTTTSLNAADGGVKGVAVYGDGVHGESQYDNGIYGKSTNSTGIFGETTGGASGIEGRTSFNSNTSAGLRGTSVVTNAYGGYFNNTVNKYNSLYVDGDARQTLAGDGLVKAAALVTCSSTGSDIERSFNNVNTAAITIANGASPGRCTVDFGFNVSTRFVIVQIYGSGASSGRIVNADPGADTEKIDIFRFDAGGTGISGNVVIIVY